MALSGRSSSARLRRSVIAGVAPASQSQAVGVDGIIGFHLNSRRLPISSMQLDIFADSRDVMLRNDVLSALQRYDARETQQTLRRLSDEYPDDDSVPQLTALAGALDLRSTVAFSKHQVAAEARCALVEKTTPAALRMWGEQVPTANVRITSRVRARHGRG